MTEHPYQPGTVWAPKRGVARRRVIVERPANAPVWHNEIWYRQVMSDGRHGELRSCWITTMQDWAGERMEL